jgi:hypothetical protein
LGGIGKTSTALTVLHHISLNCAPATWKKWYHKGCHFFVTANRTPPNFGPDPAQADRLKLIRQAFSEMK